jgi:hypothetical protein
VTPSEDPSSASEAEMLAQVLGRHVYDAMLADMEMRAKVERNPIKTTSDSNVTSPGAARAAGGAGAGQSASVHRGSGGHGDRF